MRKSLKLAALVLWSIAWASGVGAQEDTEAGAHFERGVELYREGSLDAALVEFERAYELSPNFRVLYNLGQIQAERHEYAAAAGLFEKYLAQGGDELPAGRRSEVEQEIVKLRARVAYLLVESNAEGAKLFVNDAQVATLPLREPLQINAGLWNVRLEKPGYASASTRVKVAGGERPRLQLPLVASERTAGGADSVPRAHANYLPFWISAATMVAFGGATLGFGLTANTADRDLDATLRQVPADRDLIADQRAQLKLWAGLTDASAAVSIVALGLATYFLLAPPRKRPPEVAHKARLAPSTRGLGLRAAF